MPRPHHYRFFHRRIEPTWRAKSLPFIGNASDGTIYVGSYDHKLYALYGRSKLASTAWTVFHYDLKHTGRKP